MLKLPIESFIALVQSKKSGCAITFDALIGVFCKLKNNGKFFSFKIAQNLVYSIYSHCTRRFYTCLITSIGATHRYKKGRYAKRRR